MFSIIAFGIGAPGVVNKGIIITTLADPHERDLSAEDVAEQVGDSLKVVAGIDAFTTTPPAGSVSPYRLVVLFNPARNARPERLCSDSNQPTAAAPDRVAVMMAFCSSDYRISSTVGSRGGVSGVEDPGLRDLLASTVSVLLPPQRYDINSPRSRRRS